MPTSLLPGYPDRVAGLIIEDIGAVVSDEISFVLPWEGVFATRRELEERIGARFVPYLEDSIRSSPAGWRLAFKPRDMVLSQHKMIGDHWGDWLATSCPALLLRGRDSRVTTAGASATDGAAAEKHSTADSGRRSCPPC